MRTRLEDFPINEELVDKFVEINSTVWKKNEDHSKTILINLSMVRMQVAWVLPKLLYAKGLQDSIGGDVVVLTWKENPLLTKFFNSFGFEHVAIDNLIKKDMSSTIKATCDTIAFLTKDGTGKGLKQLVKHDITCGKSLYEDIIRTSSLSTIRSTRNALCAKKMIHILSAWYALDKYVGQKNVTHAIMDDLPYHEGLFIKSFLKKKIHVFQVDNWRVKPVISADGYRIQTISEYYHKIIKDNITLAGEEDLIWSTDYLQQRFEGKNGRNIDRGAFANKKVVDRETLNKDYQLDSKKKNVVIMAHTFTDGVFNYGDIYFRDYYDWLEKTLIIASKVKDVNWILRPHPTRSAYNESTDSIEDMFERYKSDNMIFLSDDISAESIKNVADIIITIGGNAGAEFSCFGVPAIIVGNPYYGKFGYTIEPNDYKEYEESLLKINEVECLNKEQIDMARKVFSMRNNPKYDYLFGTFHDEFELKLNTLYNKLLNEKALEYFANNNGTESYNNETLEMILYYFNDNDIRKCAYYKSGKGVL